MMETEFSLFSPRIIEKYEQTYISNFSSRNGFPLWKYEAGRRLGPAGETIMDYSIFDAIRAGFGKVVFIIREQFAENFKNIFEPKLKGRIQNRICFSRVEFFYRRF